MAKINFSTLLLFSIVTILSSLPSFTLSATFTFTNKCPYTVWPGLLSGAGTASLSTTGFSLLKDESKSVSIPSSWSGRLWARTQCSVDSNTNRFSCVTADCGSGSVSCSGAGASPPATLAEFTLSGAGGLDFYDVSLVDGYNLPMLIVPSGGSGDNCSVTGCVVDLNDSCPSDLKVLGTDGGDGVACKSACEAFGEPKYCCSGEFATPDTCKPSSYSEVFKSACPRAYSYAYDDKTSTFTCGGSPDYLITFCSEPTTSKKATTEQGQGQPSSNTNTLPIMNNSMVYEGAQLDVNSASSSTRTHVVSSRIIVGALPILATVWRLCQLF